MRRDNFVQFSILVVKVSYNISEKAEKCEMNCKEERDPYGHSHVYLVAVDGRGLVSTIPLMGASLAITVMAATVLMVIGAVLAIACWTGEGRGQVGGWEGGDYRLGLGLGHVNRLHNWGRYHHVLLAV